MQAVKREAEAAWACLQTECQALLADLLAAPSLQSVPRSGVHATGQPVWHADVASSLLGAQVPGMQCKAVLMADPAASWAFSAASVHAVPGKRGAVQAGAPARGSSCPATASSPSPLTSRCVLREHWCHAANDASLLCRVCRTLPHLLREQHDC